jgi:hypothetical protein
MSDVELTNYLALYAKGQQALTANQTFIGNAAGVSGPLSAAQQTALVNQTVALTQQVDAIIRVLLGLLTDTGGT